MLASLCQLKSRSVFLLLLCGGCAFFKSDKHLSESNELLTPVESRWFSKNLNHSLVDHSGAVQVHHFFDVKPELDRGDTFINAFILTPEGSEHSYQLDLTSGQRYFSHSYCPQNDVWNNFSGSLNRPNYTVGVVPRLLDQLGEPQKVVIFGGEKKFSAQLHAHEHRIKLVGAVIEQHCQEGNCLGKNNWISRMIFLGVDPEDKKLASTTDLKELLKKVDWAKAKAGLENLDGRNGTEGATFPAVRIGNLIPLKEAMDYYKKRSIFMSDKESSKIQNGCYALYDRLWKEVGQEQPEDKPAKTIEELKAKLKVVEELKKKRAVGFANRFRAFAQKYANEFSTCQRFVYSGNLNKNPEQFWFLSYAAIFFRLHKEGHYYDCKTRSWQKNLLNSSGEWVFNMKNGFQDCRERDFDQAMDYLPNYLTSLKLSEGSYYRFVDYDTHTFGTHQKLYSWVKMKNRTFNCSFDPNQNVKKEMRSFPEDVQWKHRDVKDIEDEMKIIY